MTRRTTDSEYQATREAALPSAACSPSKVEEIIAVLWTILWTILWVNNAHPAALWFVGIKAGLDHLTAIHFAIQEIRRENAKGEAQPPAKKL